MKMFDAGKTRVIGLPHGGKSMTVRVTFMSEVKSEVSISLQ